MKKMICTVMVLLAMGAMLEGCTSNNETPQPVNTQPAVTQPVSTQPAETAKPNNVEKEITEEMAYEGVSNYCHTTYDWSQAEENPSLMSVELGEESETEYQVKFRSYTGSFVYFYVNKASGLTRMVESVPDMEIEEEAGTINIYDYLEHTME